MNIKKLLFCVLAITVITAKSQVNPTIQWKISVSQDATISGISTGLDGNSNVYSAGRIEYTPGNADIIVQCADSTGVILWTYSYDNGAYDAPQKIRLDGAGNTYITGISYDSGTGGVDYITIKIDNLGNAKWINRFDRGFNSADEAYDLCIDSNFDVYTTGKSRNSNGDFDVVTLKLDGTSGTQLWQHVLNPNNLDDAGVGIVLANNQSDVIIGSNSNGPTNGTDIVAYQLNAASGGIGWIRTINGTSNSNDNCSSIILAGGNIVLCGMVDKSGTGEDYIVAKLDGSNGTILFQNDYDFSSTDIATSLVRDSTGNIAVTGVVFNLGTSKYEYHTHCYDSLGNGLWLHKKEINCNSINVNPTIVCDTIAHHFYIAGEEENTDRDILVYQLTPGGNLGWEKSYNSTNGPDVATSLVVNGIGVIFVSSSTSNSGGLFDITTLKIVQTPVYFPPDYGTQELKDERFVFEKNQGQLLDPSGSSITEAEVGYFNQGCSPAYYFNNSSISHIVSDRDSILDSLVRVDLKILGANALADIFHYNPIDAKKNYFITSPQGITDVISYERLFIPEVFPNVDLHHYSNTRGLKSYFVFKTPGESMAAMRLQVEGADSSKIRSNHLIAYTELGTINMGMLTAYQATYNVSTQTFVLMPLTVSWNSLGSNMYNFSVSGASAFWPVVVYISKPGATSAPSAPPIGNLYWSTFVGGQGYEESYKSRVDAKDNYYTTGSTFAINYPVSVGAFQGNPPSTAGSQWGLLSKYDKQGKYIYGTYFGGTGNSCGGSGQTLILDVAIDSLYSLYIVGLTTSNNMATQTNTITNSINYSTNSGGTQCQDGFIAKLNPLGNILRYSTYYGGNGVDRFNTVKYHNGQIIIAGASQSTNLPLVTPAANTHWQTIGSGIYLHLDTAGTLIHNTKLSNSITGADIDKNGNIYMVATSLAYALSGVHANIAGSYTQAISPGNVDWTLQKFNTADSLTWSTYIGGNSTDYASGICIRDSIMVIVGEGTSTNWPWVKSVSDSGEVAYKNGWDAQIVKFNIKSGQMLWSVYHATQNDERPKGVAIDQDYNVYVTGNVKCGPLTGTATACPGSDFKPLAFQNYYGQNNKIGYDAFIIGYNYANSRVWTTYFGSLSSSGTSIYHDDNSYSIVMNNNNKLFINGTTTVKNNSLPMVKWNNVCFYDSIVAEVTASPNTDAFISMFDVTEFRIVGIKEITKNTGSEYVLYPNPNKGTFMLKRKDAKPGNTAITVLNLMGQKVFESNYINNDAADQSINLGSLSKGIYLIIIEEQDLHPSTMKFIIE